MEFKVLNHLGGIVGSVSSSGRVVDHQGYIRGKLVNEEFLLQRDVELGSCQIRDHQEHMIATVDADQKIVNYAGYIIGEISDGKILNHQGYIFGEVPNASPNLAAAAAVLLLLGSDGTSVGKDGKVSN